jgi:hypothetical protein
MRRVGFVSLLCMLVALTPSTAHAGSPRSTHQRPRHHHRHPRRHRHSSGRHGDHRVRHASVKRPVAVSAPRLRGTPRAGDTLRISDGHWRGRPSAYRDHWRVCDTHTARCRSITDATGATLKVTSADVGHRIRAIVSAINRAGTTAARTHDTAVIAAAITARTTPGACGYPDPNDENVGVANCSALPAWTPADLPAGSDNASGNDVDLTGSDLTISGYDIGNYLLYITGRDVTLNDDCISYDGSDFSGGQSSAISVWGASSSTGLTVENSTIVAQGCSASASSVCSGSGVNQTLITSGGAADATIRNDVLAGAVEPINSLGPGSLIAGNYVVANGILSDGHGEDIYEAGTSGVTIDHNTLLNPMDQTAVIFGDSSGDSACDTGFDITDNLLAGGGYILYACAHASNQGSSTLTFTENDIARCGAVATYDPALGGESCGAADPLNTQGAAIGSGADSHGFWPQGGYFGLTESTWCPGATNWSGNFYDNSGAAVACP